jgi:hypothetical protein
VLEIQDFERKVYTVKAVRVTKSNLVEVANWCGGTVRTPPVISFCIDMVSTKGFSKRQRALIGDWVVSYGPYTFEVLKNFEFETKFQSRF